MLLRNYKGPHYYNKKKVMILGRFAKMPGFKAPPPKYSQNVAKKRILSNESGQNLKKERKWPDLVDPKSHQYSVKWRNRSKFSIFGPFFPPSFWFSVPNNQLKSALFEKKSNLNYISALFSL